MTNPKRCPACGSDDPKRLEYPCDTTRLTTLPNTFHNTPAGGRSSEEDYDDWVGNKMPLSSLINVEPEEGVE